MSMKAIENANTTKVNATRVSVYINTSKTLQINQQQACGSDKYENEHILAFAMEFSRRRDYEPSTLRTFCRLKTCVYKRARQSG